MARFSTIALGAAAFGLAVSSAASAHPKLTASTPANGAVVSNLRSLSLNFSEKLVPAFSGGKLVMTAMPGMQGHRPMAVPVEASVAGNGRTLMLTSKTRLQPGTYKLDWRVVSSDTHPVTGSLSFKVR